MCRTLQWHRQKKSLFIYFKIWTRDLSHKLSDLKTTTTKKFWHKKRRKKWQEKVDDSIFAQKTDKKKYCISEDLVYGTFTSIFSLKSSFNEITDLGKFQPSSLLNVTTDNAISCCLCVQIDKVPNLSLIISFTLLKEGYFVWKKSVFFTLVVT